MKYFMTGATGFVGGVIAKSLRMEAHEIAAVVRDEARANHLAAKGVKIYSGDVTDKESMREPMEAVDGVFHVAGWYKVGLKDKSPAIPVNIDGARNVLELMRELNIPRGVYTSTLAINSDTHGELKDETFRFEGKHLREYDRTKWVAHYEIAEPMIRSGLPLTIVMPGAIYGPGDTSQLGSSFRSYLQRKLPMIPGRSGLSLAHVDDIAQGHILAMDKGVSGESYIICGESKTSVEVFQLAESITGIPAPRFVLPPEGMKMSAALIKPFESLLTLPPTYTSEGIRVLAGATYYGNNSKARKELDYSPRSIEEGLPGTLAALQQELVAGL